MMKKIILNLGITLCLISAAHGAVELNKSSDGNIVLSNRFLSAKISPVKGARVIQLLDKRSSREYAGSDWDMGIGGELDWQERQLTASTYFGKPYSYTVEKFSDRAVIHCMRTGSGAVGQWITIHKDYTLKDNESMLTLDYRIEVNPAAMATLSFCLWLHNSAQVKNVPGTIRFIKNGGLKTIAYNSGSPLNESFHYDLADGWFALDCSGRKGGIIEQVPYQDLMCLYNWQGAQGNTLELLFRSRKIPCGTSYNTQLVMMLYDGFSAPDGSGCGLAASVQGKTLKLYAAKNAKGTIAVSSRRPPQLIENPLAQLNFDIKAGECRTFTIPAAQKGSERIFRVSNGKQAFFTMRQPEQIAGYQYLPVMARRGNDAERYGQVILNAADRQDCFQWHSDLPINGGRPLLKPDVAGRQKLLIVTDIKCGKEVTELANRMDADSFSCTFGTGGWLNWTPVWGHTSGSPEMNIYLEEMLKKDYDAIVLGCVNINVISKDNLKRIADKVGKGTGLVCVMPKMIPEEYQSLVPVKPLIKESFKRIDPKLAHSGNFRVGASSPVKNFPFEALDPVWIFPYQSKNAEITTGKLPFFVTGKYGKGKVAVFSWLSGRPDNTRRGGLIPFFAKETKLPWHELYYGMLIQAIRWSDNRVSPLRIESFSVRNGTAQIVLNNTLKRNIQADLEFSGNHESVEFSAFHTVKKVKPGKNTLSMPLKYSFLTGTNLLALRLGAENLAMDFAFAAVKAQNGAEIKSIRTANQLFPAGKALEAEITTAGTFDSGRVTLMDAMGRILAQTPLKGNKATLTPRGVYTHYARIYVELFRNGKLLDKKEEIIDLIPEHELERSWNNYNVMISWPLRDTRAFPFFLRPHWEKVMKDLGVNSVMVHGIPTHWGQDNEAKYGLNYRYVGSIVMESVARISGSSGIKGFTYPPFEYRNRKKELRDMQAAYAKTKNKFLIRRSPRMDDPVFLDAYAKAMAKYWPALTRWKPFIYDMGDEMSYGEFNSPIDFDFSPESLQAFRKWLIVRYNNDLARLNREWQRSYQSWDEVIPDTGLEARERGNFSSWSLHRLYNCELFAGFWNLVSTNIKKLDPGARVSASGTPAPHPYDAYDYELLMKSVDTLSAYTAPGHAGLLTAQKKIPLTAWDGYGRGASSNWPRIWNNAFNGHYGVSLYSEPNIFNPDLTLTPCGQSLKEAIKPLRHGVGRLLYNAQTPVQTAILNSSPSMMAAWAKYSVNDYDGCRGGWVELLKQQNCNARFIFPSQLNENGLKPYKVLILPMALALSDAQCKAIADFAGRGGAVIADVKPAIFNENVAKVSSDRLAGVKIFSTGSKLQPGSSAAIMTKTGTELRKLLLKAGVIPAKSPVSVISGKAGFYSYLLCPQGGILYGILNTQATAAKLKITIPHGCSAFAVLQKKAVKEELEIPPFRPEVVAILPYRVTGLNVSAQVENGKLVMSAQPAVSTGRVLRHVIDFRVFKNGKELEYLRRNCETVNGKAEIVLPLALNEKGPFCVKAYDLISGTKGENIR